MLIDVRKHSDNSYSVTVENTKNKKLFYHGKSRNNCIKKVKSIIQIFEAKNKLNTNDEINVKMLDKKYVVHLNEMIEYP